MKRVNLEGVSIEVVSADIASQPDVEAVVNAANAQLKIGGGVAGAIHRTAGPELAEETKEYAPIEPGEAVLSGGYNLPNDYVIHTLGPRWGKDTPEEKLLTSCYDESLTVADENNIESIAFPAISTGAFGYPFEEGTEVALKTVSSRAGDLENLELIRFVLFSDSDRDIYEEKMGEYV